MKDPLWRTCLNWGAVITFFTAPLLIFLLQVTSEESWNKWLNFAEHIGEFKWLAQFYASVTALVFGLAGLNSWDKRIANGKQEPQPLQKGR